MGEEMLTPLADFFFGDRRAERIDAVFDCGRSTSLAFDRFKLAGLTLSFLDSVLGVGLSRIGGGY